jgi:3-oxoacyl-[acyl-carrier protein] reductase
MRHGGILVRLTGKAAIVTGSSRGIGAAIALKLAAEGADVVVNYRTQHGRADAVAQQIAAAGRRAVVVEADVVLPGSGERLVKTSLESFGRLDILVNNAGITRDNLLMRMSEEDWDLVLDSNLKSAFLLTRAALRPMLRQHSGRIVNITSVGGITGNAGQANYAASKAGLIGLTRATAREVASRQITCNAVAPGMIRTDILESVAAAVLDQIRARIPLQRPGTPEDIAEAVAFLVSDGAQYITGQVINVDGGLLMG